MAGRYSRPASSSRDPAAPSAPGANSRAVPVLPRPAHRACARRRWRRASPRWAGLWRGRHTARPWPTNTSLRRPARSPGIRRRPTRRLAPGPGCAERRSAPARITATRPAPLRCSTGAPALAGAGMMPGASQPVPWLDVMVGSCSESRLSQALCPTASARRCAVRQPMQGNGDNERAGCSSHARPLPVPCELAAVAGTLTDRSTIPRST